MEINLKDLFSVMGMFAAIVLPLWNIPLIVKIIKRRSSRDLSLSWALGVWVCNLIMAPSAFLSTDPVWRTFYTINLVMFSGVVVVTLKYRNKPA